jgi:hypothetical protein
MTQNQSNQTWVLTLAGVLDICAGVSGLIGSVPVAMIAVGVSGLAIPVDSLAGAVPMSLMGIFFACLSAMLFVAGVVSIVGGVHAIQRKSRLWALAGAIAAVFSCLPFGVLSVILTVISEGDLED